MKKTAIAILIVMVILLAGCAEKTEFDIGDKGPAGGWIFYDCDADNESGNADGLVSNDCGWRYLEVAPKDITVGDDSAFVFGYYRTAAGGSNLFVNGTTTYDGNCTGTAVGTGETNTAKLVEKMGSEAYSDSNGTGKTANYAAKLCDDYTYGGYDDWFLPSIDELDLINTNLRSNGIGRFSSSSYWSSSESGSYSNSNGSAYYVWTRAMGNGNRNELGRRYLYNVRAVRAF